MAKASQRAAAGLLAAIFFFTSVGATAYVIWKINSEEPVATGSQEDTTLSSDGAIDPNALKGKPLEGFTPRAIAASILESTDLIVGTGAEASLSSSLVVNYTGALASDGIVFESSLDSGQPASFALAEVIQGWQQGVPGMKVGGKRRLVIPYIQGYGEAGSPPTIPERADLVFDIELLDVQ